MFVIYYNQEQPRHFTAETKLRELKNIISNYRKNTNHDFKHVGVPLLMDYIVKYYNYEGN